MKIAIYPGSFDPITKGHLDILKNASGIFDKVIIAVARNGEKKGFLSTEERVELIKKSIEGLDNVEVDAFEGLTIEYAKKRGAEILIRGLRAVSDFEYEMQSFGYPVVFDATHSVQLPGANGSSSGGDRRFVPYLAKAAMAVGANVLFFEVHPDPEKALCDGPNMIALKDAKKLFSTCKKIYELVKE